MRQVLNWIMTFTSIGASWEPRRLRLPRQLQLVRLCNSSGIVGSRGLCQRSAGQFCTGLQHNRCLIQYDSLKVRCRAKGRLAGYLPENVLGLCAARQVYNDAAAHGEFLRYLEDPDIICAAKESETGWDGDVSAPFIDAGNECHSTNIPRTEFGNVRCASSSVGVGGLHSTYGRGQGTGGWRRVVSGVYVAGHQGGCRESTGSIHGESEPGDGGAVDRAHSQVSNNRSGSSG